MAEVLEFPADAPRVRSYVLPWPYANPRARFFIEAIRQDKAVESFSFDENADSVHVSVVLVQGATAFENRGLEGQALPFDSALSAALPDRWAAEKQKEPSLWARLLLGNDDYEG